MKKVFTILGICFAGIIVILVIIAAIFIPRVLKLDRQAVAYLQDAVPKIVSGWNSEELTERATPDLLVAVQSHNDLARLFVLYRKLGAFKKCDKPEGNINSFTSSKSGTTTIGNYTVHGIFENGKATIQVQVLRVNDNWKINGFRIDSDAFLPPVN